MYLEIDRTLLLYLNYFVLKFCEFFSWLCTQLKDRLLNFKNTRANDIDSFFPLLLPVFCLLSDAVLQLDHSALGLIYLLSWLLTIRFCFTIFFFSFSWVSTIICLTVVYISCPHFLRWSSWWIVLRRALIYFYTSCSWWLTSFIYDYESAALLLICSFFIFSSSRRDSYVWWNYLVCCSICDKIWALPARGKVLMFRW